MPAIGLNVMISGVTTETVKISNGISTLEFFVEERLGEKEPKDYWVEVKHDSNNTYLANKTNAINQTMRSTTAILVGLMTYEPPTDDSNTSEGKHVLNLEDISLISTNSQNRTNTSNITLPWDNSGSPSRSPSKSTRQPTRKSSAKRPRTTLAQMDGTTTTPSPKNQSIAAALEINPMPQELIPQEVPQVSVPQESEKQDEDQ